MSRKILFIIAIVLVIELSGHGILTSLFRLLGQSKFLAGENYSIADIATWPWMARHEWHDIGLAKHSNLSRWYLEIAKRPAVDRGYKFMDKNLEIPLP